MIVVHILCTIIGLIVITRGFVTPEFIENVREFIEDLVESIKEEDDKETDDEETVEDKVAEKIAEIFYWIVRIIWMIMWLVSGLSIIVLSWFGFKLPSLWYSILVVGIFNPILIMCCIIAFWGLLHLIFGRY